MEKEREEDKEKTFKRYLEGLNLKEEDIKNKRILDLGCGTEGEFVRACADKDLTEEIYGLDLRIDFEEIKDKYKNNFFAGDFEKEFPVQNLDYAVSVGAINAPWNEEKDKKGLEQALVQATQAIKSGGEIRIYPIQKCSEESELEGIKERRKTMEEILQKIAPQLNIEYQFEPIDVSISGKDLWLNELLIIRKGVEEERQSISD